MRKFAQIRPTFWTRGSGKRLRGKRDAQVLALYLMTSPVGSRTGLYYEPMVGILHNTGITEEMFRKAIDNISEIARYDFEEELVWLPNGCREQMGLQDGARIKPGDKSLRAVLTELESFGEHPFALEFKARYLPMGTQLSGQQVPPTMGDTASKDGASASAACPPSPFPSPSTPKEGESEGEAKPGGQTKVPCPGPDQALNSDQRKTLLMTMPEWALEVMLTEWCAERQARGDRHTLRAWRTFCAKDLIARWNNPERRPKKPEDPAAKAKASEAAKARHERRSAEVKAQRARDLEAASQGKPGTAAVPSGGVQGLLTEIGK